MTNNGTTPSLYVRVGGDEFFEQLVATFYQAVSEDDALAPIYPEYPDFTGARHRLTMFLIQYWGGPTTYSIERGHPRLRMRHFPFRVGTLERDRWLTHMAKAVKSVCDSPDIDDGVAAELMAYFVPVAESMRNDTGLPITDAAFRQQQGQQ